MEWPGYDNDELFGFHKVINEPDFLPLYFVGVLTQAARLFRLIAESWWRRLCVGKSSTGNSTDPYRLFSSMSHCGV
jgi:hypothetical protein